MREQVLLAQRFDLRNGLPFAANHGQIGFSDPQRSFEEPLSRKNLPRADVFDEALHAVDCLLAFVLPFVERTLSRGEQKRIYVADVGEIFGRQFDARQGISRALDHLFVADAIGRKSDVAHLVILARDGAVIVELLNRDGLPVGVVLARAGVFGLALGNLLKKARRAGQRRAPATPGKTNPDATMRAMFRTMRPFFIALLCSWIALLVAALVYCEATSPVPLDHDRGASRLPGGSCFLSGIRVRRDHARGLAATRFAPGASRPFYGSVRCCRT